MAGFLLVAIFTHTRGITYDDRVWWDVSRNNCPGADDRAFGNDDTAENYRAGADARSAPHSGRLEAPVSFRLQIAARSSRTRMFIVNEIDAMTYENFVFDVDAFANKRMA